ncbi:hypothetical protein ESY86_20310 [Subsaximicrobium wynnwilliamsii]|uniref:Uncharacterized protein n=1 Tax=Subsaximicrobium wynnwilliamsii TaxID=291179 RepID=A0A5C6ZAD8_9FLAO|nr:hypothetical protein [Subsaximicrobium wynnwilliamsii]TXD80705.1 hypothetical protein ESY87_20330 [Subsaximicrobium wynnwilliamsii]TXD86384.1 hypothetical protein ESY86_20310 [Subsaximicrobium wynnwilliamsii]TXD99931.1 hypothetical protein ESY88_20275 [Subsaximicrobium wynnwilliamsii]
MRKILVLLLLISSFANGQKLIKKTEENKVKLDNSMKIFSSNAGYCKIYKLTENIFALHNGYMEGNKITYVDKNALDEIIKASEMINDADFGDKVELVSIEMDIEKKKIIGTAYVFTIYKNETTTDLSDLTLTEIRELMETADLNSVESDGVKVVDKVKTITSEKAHSFMTLTKKELEILIELKY